MTNKPKQGFSEKPDSLTNQRPLHSQNASKNKIPTSLVSINPQPKILKGRTKELKGIVKEGLKDFISDLETKDLFENLQDNFDDEEWENTNIDFDKLSEISNQAINTMQSLRNYIVKVVMEDEDLQKLMQVEESK